MGWMDTHAHLVSDELFERFDEIKQNAIDHGVTKVCIICGDMIEVKRALSVCEGDPMFDLAIGVHPSSVKDIPLSQQEEMFTYLKHPQVKFVGEIGLDYYWDQSFNELQKERFINQIEIANEHDLPIIIHIREASDDVYEILKNHKVNRTGIVHSFTEDVESAQRFIDLGFYVGIGGIVTFKNGENIRRLVLNLPVDKLLSETDSPYLTPVPYRGKRNESAYVSYVGKAMAELKGISDEEMQEIIKENYNTLTKESK